MSSPELLEIVSLGGFAPLPDVAGGLSNGHSIMALLEVGTTGSAAPLPETGKTHSLEPVDPDALPYRPGEFQTKEIDERFLTKGQIYRRECLTDPVVVTARRAVAPGSTVGEPITIQTPNGPKSVIPKYGQIVVCDAAGMPVNVMGAREFRRHYEVCDFNQQAILGAVYVAKPEIVRVIPHPSGKGMLASTFDPKRPDKVLFDRYPISDTRFTEFRFDEVYGRRLEVVTEAATEAVPKAVPKIRPPKEFDFFAQPQPDEMRVSVWTLNRVAELIRERDVRQPTPRPAHNQPIPAYDALAEVSGRPSRLKRIAVAAVLGGAVLLGVILGKEAPQTEPTPRPATEVNSTTPTSPPGLVLLPDSPFARS